MGKRINHKDDFYWNLLIELRKETVEAQKLRAQLIGFKITFVSTAIGIIVANIGKLSPLLLFIPAFAAIFFDFLIESYSFSIKRIGHYCRNHVEPFIRKQKRLDKSFLLWEEFMGKPETKQIFTVVGNFGITCLAVVPAIFSLLFPFDFKTSAPLFILLLILLIYDVHTFLRIGRIQQSGLLSTKVKRKLQDKTKKA